VPSSCPICEQPIPSTVAHCMVCGFPTALAIEALRSLSGFDAPSLDVADVLAPSPPRTKPKPPPLSPEGELTAAISRDLRTKLDLVRELGRGAPDVTSEMCQAALSEAEGRMSEALDILRSAQSRLETETDELLRRRLEALEERRTALQQSGIKFAIADDIQRLRDAIESDRREEAAGLLADTERRIAQFESDWKGLQGLLTQVEGLRSEAAALGIPLGEISGELEGIRDRLNSGALTEDALDEAAQDAAQTLMLLHEAIPTSLEEELGRHEVTLNAFPDDHPPSAIARRLHVEATRHLNKGRLSDAVASVRELRSQLEILAKEPPPTTPTGGEEVSAAPPLDETEADALDRLLKKARTLAARVRTLPSDSDTARDAAMQIREATDHLRDRRLKEADLTLTRLMRMLAYETPRS
jgi:DNA repair exonuclease SbcCD ATPase subunit